MTKTPWRAIGWSLAALMLALPLVAMQVTRDVNWGPEDFIVFGAMILGAGAALELAARASGSVAYRAGAAVAVAGAFLLVWANLAVGIIGDEGNPLNLIFAGVLAVAIGGALATRGSPAGMAATLGATAAAQALAAIPSLAGGVETLAINGVFVGFWLASAALFGKAAKDAARVALG